MFCIRLPISLVIKIQDGDQAHLVAVHVVEYPFPQGGFLQASSAAWFELHTFSESLVPPESLDALCSSGYRCHSACQGGKADIRLMPLQARISP